MMLLGLGSSPLSVYLNDHLAGATAGVDLAHRVADAALATEVEEDREALLDVMRRLSVGRDHLKLALGWGAEKAMRLKPAGGAALRRLEDLEAMSLGVEGKLALWKALQRTYGDDPRLRGVDLDELIARARSQRRRLERLRMGAADEALG